MSTSIQLERIQPLNDRRARDGDYVLYWMQQSQRARCNHALEYAIGRANEKKLPVVVAFGLTDDYPEANLRHYRFMLEGLREVEQSLADRGIRMLVELGRPDEVALAAADAAALVVCDRGYLRHQKAWRERVARVARCEVVQVEADVVVPVETASNKAEYGARTIRPKVTKLWDRFLAPLRSTPVRRDSLGLGRSAVDLGDIDGLLRRLRIDQSVKPVARFRGGTSRAEAVLRAFLRDEFARYAAHRNRPETDSVSHMAMYLHFGQISPVYVAMAVRRSRAGRANRAAYLEELLVRRELAQNFVHFTTDYDRFGCLPDWARRTLDAHRGDPREYVYTRREFEAARTHDPYWNAAMREMVSTGYMHNYMRMYWGKKILEWSRTPESAFRTALALNNKYFLDGRDPSAYANVAWIFGLHDRPFGERPVYGTVRSMSAAGLARKCDIEAYVAKVERLAAR